MKMPNLNLEKFRPTVGVGLSILAIIVIGGHAAGVPSEVLNEVAETVGMILMAVVNLDRQT